MINLGVSVKETEEHELIVAVKKIAVHEIYQKPPTAFLKPQSKSVDSRAIVKASTPMQKSSSKFLAKKTEMLP